VIADEVISVFRLQRRPMYASDGLTADARDDLSAGDDP
jgi:hypothetical protein